MKKPWLDVHLTEEGMKYLWDIINHPVHEQTDARKSLAGNISKSYWILDNQYNWFFENVLKEYAELMYYKDWNNYYNVHITKTFPPPIFTLKEMWVNYQKQHEFNPPHNHSGEFSFVVFMKIPTHWKEQYALPFSTNSNVPCASDFQFLGHGTGGYTGQFNISLSPEDESRMLFFPAWLLHQVFPFYGTDEERITISGNVIIQEDKTMLQKSLNEMEKELKLKEKYVYDLEKVIIKKKQQIVMAQRKGE